MLKKNIVHFLTLNLEGGGGGGCLELPLESLKKQQFIKRTNVLTILGHELKEWVRVKAIYCRCFATKSASG